MATKRSSKRAWCGIPSWVFAALVLCAGILGPSLALAAPFLGAMVEHNWVEGNGFPANSPVAVSVNTGAKGMLASSTDAGGHFFINWWDAGNANALATGDTISAVCNAQTVTMVIHNLTAAVDLAGNRVTGTAFSNSGSALAQRTVHMDIFSSPAGSVVASASATVLANGSFTVATAFDIVRGQMIILSLFDTLDGSDGHRTLREVYNAIPILQTTVDHNTINGRGFLPNVAVTVSVNNGAKGTRPATTDTGGNFQVNWGENAEPANLLQIGDTVSSVCNGVTETMVLKNVTAAVNLTTDLVSGTAFDNANSPLVGRTVVLQIYEPFWGPQLASAQATVGANGGFTLDPAFDIVRGQKVLVSLVDVTDGSVLGHWTRREIYNAIPALGANQDNNMIDGDGFPFNAPATISVNGGAKGTLQTTTNPSGYLQVNWWDAGAANHLRTGDLIRVVCNGETTEMVIQNVAGTVDLAANRVSGTAFAPNGGAALSGSQVRISISPPGGWPELAYAEATVAANGSFSADFTYDIVRGQYIDLAVWNAADGPASYHRTHRMIYNGIPALNANIDYNGINGDGFPFDAPATVTVNGGAKGTLQVTTNSNGYMNANWWDAGDANHLRTGDVVRVICNGETTEMVIQNVTGTVDLAANRISGTAFVPNGGTALVGRKVNVSIASPGQGWNELAYAQATVAANGSFTVNFTFDIVRGQQIQLTVWHAADGSTNGHRTQRQIYNGIPALGAMAAQNWVEGSGFPPEAAVTISVNNGAKGTLQASTNSNGDFFRNWWDAGDANALLPGDLIRAVCNGETTEMVIQNVNATVDLAANRVSGTAFAPNGGAALVGRKVSVSINVPGGGGTDLAYGEAIVAANGSFTVNFTYDIVRGQSIYLNLWHAADGSTTGHRTAYEIYNGIPALGAMVEYNLIFGNDFPFNTTVNVFVNDGAKGSLQATTNPQGNFMVNWWDAGNANALQPGDTVRVAYGTTNVEMVIANVNASVDLVGNRVTGTAFDQSNAALVGRKVKVTIFNGMAGDWSSGAVASAETTVGANGSFTVPFTIDIVRGQGIWLDLWHAADGSATGHRTARDVYNHIPTLGVMVDHQWIQGGGFPPSTSVVVRVNSGAKGGDTTVTSDSWGNLEINWWQKQNVERLAVGDTIGATWNAGAESTQMVVQNVTATLDIANDVVSGTALNAVGGAPLSGNVNVHVQLSWNQQQPSAWLDTPVAANGTFSLNFTGLWDLQRGQGVFLTYTAPDGHQTMREPKAVDIVGAVTDGSTGLAGVKVEIYDPYEGPDVIEGETWTDADGNYTLKGALPGSYRLFFNPADYNQVHDTNFVAEWFDNKPNYDGATAVDITTTGAVLTRNAQLANTGGRISGRVLGNGAAPLAGITVVLLDVAFFANGGNGIAVWAVTDATGNYALRGIPPGSFKALFYPDDYNQAHSTNYAFEWYNNQSNFDLAEVFTVTGGYVRQNVDATLGAGGLISGRITGDGGVPLFEVGVSVVTPTGSWAGDTETDADGRYTLGGLPPGSGVYRVKFEPDEDVQSGYAYATEWYDNKGSLATATPVSVVANATTQVDAVLQRGGRISGTVSAADGGNLGAQVAVQFYSPAGALLGTIQTTASSGYSYQTHTGVPAGSYFVKFVPGAAYQAEFYNAKGDIGSATPVVVVSSTVTGGINATLDPAGMNHPPVFVKGANPTVLEDAGAQTVNGWATGINAGWPTESAQTLSFTATNNNNALFSAQPAVAANGTLTYTPAANKSGLATVTLTLRDNGGTALGGSDTSASQTFTITVTPVNDPPTLNALLPLTINENAGLQTVSLSGIAAGGGETQTLTVTASSSNTALIPNPTVTYTSPNATGSIAFTPVTNVSGTSTVTVTVNDSQSANNLFSRQFLVTVQPLTRTLRFTQAASSGSEATTPAAIGVSLSAASAQTVTVNYATANGTATAGSDYTATTGALTFTPGVTTQTISVPVTNDTAVEMNETFTVTLTNPVNATLGATIVHTYTINDNDSPTVYFNFSASGSLETTPSATIYVSLSAASGRSVTVNYATANGTATAGSDYTATSGTLTFAPGTTSQTFSVPVLADTIQEGSETFTAALTNPVNATLGVSFPTTTHTIYDDMVPGVAGLKTIAAAVDQPGWTFTTSPGANWGLQSAITHDGMDAARSGFIADGQTSSFQTTGSFGSGTMSFWWKISSRPAGGELIFSIDGVIKGVITGEVGWRQQTFDVTAGSHTLKWEYHQISRGISGIDAAWVDQLVLPAAQVLWTRGDTGEADLWTGEAGLLPGALAISGRTQLTVPAADAGPWEATSCAPAGASADYVLWSRGDIGQAVLAKVDRDAPPGSSPVVDWAYLSVPNGEGSPWQATGYVPVDDSTSYVLWSRGDIGRAILGKVSPGAVTSTIPITSWAYLDAPGGSGGPWQAVSYAQTDAATGYVLWSRDDTGQAILAQVVPGEISGTVPVTSWAYLQTPAGVGAPWLATSYTHINALEGYVLWTRGDTGQAILWQVAPGAVAGTIPVTSWTYVSTPAGVGAPWRATGYVHGSTPGTPAGGAAPTPAAVTNSGN